MSVAADDSDTAGDADADGVARGSAPIALTHTKPISATKTRVVVINHHCIDDLSRNGANVKRGPHRGRLHSVRHTTADQTAAHRKSDQRRDDLCVDGLRKGASL